MEECYLPPCSLDCSYTAHAYLPRDGAAHGGLPLPHQSLVKSISQTQQQENAIQAIPQLRLPPSRNHRLYQVDNKTSQNSKRFYSGHLSTHISLRLFGTQERSARPYSDSPMAFCDNGLVPTHQHHPSLANEPSQSVSPYWVIQASHFGFGFPFL